MPTPPLVKHAQNRLHPRRLVNRSSLTVALVSAVAAASAVVCTGPATAQTSSSTVTLKSTADTYTSASSPKSNYGKVDTLRVTSQAGQAKTSYLSFTVPATPGQRVSKAELVVKRTGHHLPVTKMSALNLAGFKENESSLTAANAPKGGTVVATATTSTTTQSVSFDVTTAVKQSGTVAFALTSPVTTDVLQFASREDGATGPELVLTTTPTTTPPPTCTVSKLLVSSCGRWLGIAAQAYSGESGPTALAYDENFTGSDFALAHEYKSNGTLFPTASDMSIANQPGHNRVLLENWKPATDMSWAKVAAGGADARIDAEAAYLKSHFNLPFFLTIWHEPENDVNPASGSGMTVSDYQAMYRHTILRLRADGATKFVSVMNYMGFGRWDTMLDGLYPGDDVVDWIAYDPYQTSASGSTGHDFADMVNRPYQKSPGFYTWATTTHPSKPLMLAEWGGLYNPANPTGQADFFHSVSTQVASFPALKALVYFDIDTKYHNINGMGTTPNSGATSLAAWKAMVTAPAFATPSITYSNGTITPIKG
jgi:hypothetical protein